MIKLITPAAPAISTADLRAHCRIDGTEEDAQLEAFLAAAHQYCEDFTGLALGSQTVEELLPAFPADFELSRFPVTSIVSVNYVGLDGVEMAMSPFSYSLDDYGQRARLWPAYNTSWPETLDVVNAVRVRYVAGSLPATVRSAMLLMVGSLYENRQDQSTSQTHSLPHGVHALLALNRVNLGV